MYYMLVCDISTLRCTSTDLEEKLKIFSTRYYKISNDVWIFCAPEGLKAHCGVFANEYFITHILRKYTTPNSILFTLPIPAPDPESGQIKYYYELPDDAVEFLSVEDPDD